VKEKMIEVTDRYSKIEGYCLKQTVAKLLDSDKSEDEAEIERNRKLLKSGGRPGANAGNNNPKVKKRWKNLPWYFDRVDEHEEQYEAVDLKQYYSHSQSPFKRRSNRFNSHKLNNQTFKED
jgi:hypothetical protein